MANASSPSTFRQQYGRCFCSAGADPRIQCRAKSVTEEPRPELVWWVVELGFRRTLPKPRPNRAIGGSHAALPTERPKLRSFASFQSSCYAKVQIQILLLVFALFANIAVAVTKLVGFNWPFFSPAILLTHDIIVHRETTRRGNFIVKVTTEV